MRVLRHFDFDWMLLKLNVNVFTIQIVTQFILIYNTHAYTCVREIHVDDVNIVYARHYRAAIDNKNEIELI